MHVLELTALQVGLRSGMSVSMCLVTLEPRLAYPAQYLFLGRHKCLIPSIYPGPPQDLPIPLTVAGTTGGLRGSSAHSTGEPFYI